MLNLPSLCGFLILLIGSIQCDCPAGWTPYKDEKCFKSLAHGTVTFERAVRACATEQTHFDLGVPTLAVIHSNEEQQFLTNLLFKVEKQVNDFWLGAKYQDSTFQWLDHSPMDYTNWFNPKGPKNQTNYCLQLQHIEEMYGKWTDESCESSNAVVCEQMQHWPYYRMQKAMIQMQKELANQKQKSDLQEIELANQRTELTQLKANPQLPVGFIYTQLPGQPEPNNLWPHMVWTDVSQTYAGVFFRIHGNGSAAFGESQSDNDHRLLRTEQGYYHDWNKPDHTVKLKMDQEQELGYHSVKTGGWMHTGDHVPDSVGYNHCLLRMVTTSGEVRPRNMAVKLWKRTG